jgi:asparagine synthase (glutamine-hydrolysing)
MCGVAGILDFRRTGFDSLELIRRMLGASHHRGPDGSGVYLDDRVALGHNRLSIIDLSGGAQPIHNEDRTLWIVYNGEVYNYPELRKGLLPRHSFYTDTDTEVIIHLFEEKGPKCLEELNGQFAFAIWNSKAHELFLARDRLGVRPLHHAMEKGVFIFASEIKSLFAFEAISREIDPVALDQIFTFWTTLAGRTAFRNIEELPPGHHLTVSLGRATLKKYWDIPFAPPDGLNRQPVEDICGQVRGLIQDAVRIRLRSDVPVGSYVSGGLDSSAITAVAKNELDSRLRTFGINFEDPSFDESEHQNRIVSFLETSHTTLEATNARIGVHFPSVVRHCEKPLLRTAPVPLFLLSGLVHQNGFKVVLSGEGADEIFGGYNIFLETKVRRFWARQPESKWRPLLVGRLYPYVFKSRGPKQLLQSFFGKGLAQVDDPFYSHRIRWQNTGRIKMFLSDRVRAEAAAHDSMGELASSLPDSFPAWDALSKAQFLEMSIFLSNYLLSSQGDRVAMAHSVEIRMPFLDHRIVEFMGRVPSVMKIQGLKEKWLLKQAFKGTLPDSTLERPKQPYRAPIHASLLNGKSEMVEDVLSDTSLKEAGLFDEEMVGRLLGKIRTAVHVGEVEEMALAGILSSQLLYRQFVSDFSYQAVASVVPTLVVDLRTIG